MCLSRVLRVTWQKTLNFPRKPNMQHQGKMSTQFDRHETGVDLSVLEQIGDHFLCRYCHGNVSTGSLMITPHVAALTF